MANGKRQTANGRNNTFAVIPAKAGIQWFLSYIPAEGGNDSKFIMPPKAGIAI